MRPKQHTVWTWKDTEKVVRFVGYGMYTIRHPAKEQFYGRFLGNSELQRWLQSLDDEPARETYGNQVVSLEEAMGFAMGLRTRYAETLLKSRDPASYSGGHPKRGVYRFCADDVSQCMAYDSVRKAAKAMACNPSTVTRWCKDPNNTTWGYIVGDD